MAKNKPLSERVAIILFAFLQNSLLGGLLFGWTSISGSLLISDKDHGGPGLSADYVHTMFVVASFFSCLGPLVMGIALDNCGPRVCSILSISLIGLGCLAFGISNESYPLFIPAMCLIAIGGPGVLNATIHLSNLFPTLRSTTTAIISGSFQFSFLVFFIFDELWVEWKWSYSLLFGSYFVICVVNAIVSMIIWPDQPYTAEEVQLEMMRSGQTLEYHKELLRAIQLPAEFIHHPKIIAKAASMPCLTFLDEANKSAVEDRRRSLSYDMATANDSFFSSYSFNANASPDFNSIEMGTFSVGYNSVLDESISQTVSPPVPDVKDLTFIEQLKSEEFISFTSFFVVINFWVNFYIGSFGLQLGDSQILAGAEEEQAFARLFTVVMTCGVIVIPVVGTMMDWVGFTVTSAVIISLGLLWSFLILIPSKTALIASFVAYTCFRTFFFTFLFAYIADTLGFKYFGALSGVMFVIGGAFGLMQYPLSQIAMGTCHLNLAGDSQTCTRGAWREVNMVMLVTIAASFLFSYRDWVRRKAAAPKEEVSLNGSARKNAKSKRMPIDNSTPFESIPFARPVKKGKDISPPRYKSIQSREDSDTSYTFSA